MQKSIEYFERPGPENTDRTLALSQRRAEELGIRQIVLASSTGHSAVRALEFFPPEQLVVVSSMYGWSEPGKPRITEDNNNRLRKAEVRLVFQTHLFRGIEQAVAEKFQGAYPAQLMAETLRIFGQGWKVCLEISMMAADSGAITMDGEIIALGGTGKGLDTAMVIAPAHSNAIFDLSIREIICTPRGK